MPSKFQKIVSYLIEAIEQGHLKRGERLPSIRKLSQTYSCSKDTVQKALLELKYQNYIYPVAKSGYYVLDNNQEELDLPELSSSEQSFTFDDFKKCLSETLVGREDYLFNYYHDQRGLSELIRSLHRLFSENDIYSKEERIVVTSGTQQALYILSRMHFPNHKKTILLEQPTYHRMNRIVNSQGIPYLTIQRGFEGLDFDRLEELFQQHDIKFFYTIPRLSNPLGLSYSHREKQTLVELADKYDVYLVEDDYMADFDRPSNVPLHYLDTHEKVIYLKSFSTTLFPALRLGSLVLPKALLEAFLAYKSLIDYDTNLIMQKALSIYIDNGMFAVNTEKLRQLHRQKRQQLKTSLTHHQLALEGRILTDSLVLKLPETHHLSVKDWDFLTSSYIGDNPHGYLSLRNDGSLDQTLSQLKDTFSP